MRIIRAGAGKGLGDVGGLRHDVVAADAGCEQGQIGLEAGVSRFFLGYERHLSRELSICECSRKPNVFVCLKQSTHIYLCVYVRHFHQELHL